MSTGVLERSAAKTASHRVSPYWRKLLKLLPGYDCFRDAAGYHFDEEAADAIIQFAETRCHHVEGALCGQLIVLQDWQKAFLGALFGWKRADGTRRYRECLLYVPRKNGKTTILAIIALYMLFCEDEGGQQIFSAAADKRQAKLAHRMAKMMIAQEPELSHLARVLVDSIECDDHHYNIITEGFRGKHGLNVNCALIDEVHEHRSRELADTLTTSQGARTQPLAMYATTAAEIGENFCNEIYEYFAAVRDGKPGFCIARALPVIYEAPVDANWKSAKVHKAANPNYDVTVPASFYIEECEKAKRLPSYQNVFRRLYLNQRTQALDVWIDVEDWNKCSGLETGETPEAWRVRAEESLRGCTCFGGLDLGAVSDLTAFALIFDGTPMGYEDALVLLPWVWCPEAVIHNKGERYRTAYEDWKRRGFLITTEGNATDYEAMREKIAEITEQFAMADMGIDYNFQGHETSIALSEQHGISVVKFSQGFMAMSAPTQDFEVRVKSKRLIHGGHPVLGWSVGHCMVESKGDLARPVKESKNSPKKIDPLVASLMALGRWHVRDQENPVSRYDRGERLMFV